MSFTAAEKLVRYIALKNELQLKENIYYQSAKFYGISPQETREHSLSVLLFVLMSDVVKYRKTLTLFFERGQITSKDVRAHCY